MENAIREDMPALRVAGELNLVDGKEVDIDIARHGFDGRDPETRTVGLDLLLARDQRHLVGADAVGDLVVDLACEEAERQADHAGVVTEHALDREVRFAGVGRAENGRHIADARFEIAAHGVRNP